MQSKKNTASLEQGMVFLFNWCCFGSWRCSVAAAAPTAQQTSNKRKCKICINMLGDISSMRRLGMQASLVYESRVNIYRLANCRNASSFYVQTSLILFKKYRVKFWREIFYIGYGLIVSGCGVPLNKIKSASERTVVIQAISGDIATSQKLAEAECQRFGRKARLLQQIQGTVDYAYDCVLWARSYQDIR